MTLINPLTASATVWKFCRTTATRVVAATSGFSFCCAAFAGTEEVKLVLYRLSRSAVRPWQEREGGEGGRSGSEDKPPRCPAKHEQAHVPPLCKPPPHELEPRARVARHPLINQWRRGAGPLSLPSRTTSFMPWVTCESTSEITTLPYLGSYCGGADVGRAAAHGAREWEMERGREGGVGLEEHRWTRRGRGRRTATTPLLDQCVRLPAVNSSTVSCLQASEAMSSRCRHCAASRGLL